MPPAPLSDRLVALARVARGNSHGLSAAGNAMLATELEAAARDARQLEATRAALQDELFDEASIAIPVRQDTAPDARQPELMDGTRIVMPRLFPPSFRVDLDGGNAAGFSTGGNAAGVAASNDR